MWRKHGDTRYALLVFAVFFLEVFGLGFLTWTFGQSLFRAIPNSQAEAVLFGTVVLTAAALILLTAYILIHHVLSTSREQWTNERVGAWTDRWVRSIYGSGPPPVPPLTAEAQMAGLNLRELLTGEEGRALTEQLQQAGVGAALVHRLGSHRLAARMEALDGLARARLPSAFHDVDRLMTDPQPVIRLMAARAAARTLAEWAPGLDRDRAARAFVGSSAAAGLPAGAAAETLLLLEEAAPLALAHLFLLPTIPIPLLRAGLDTVGRLRLTRFRDQAGSRVTHRDREVRAAALRALGRLGRVPKKAQDAVIIALADDTEFVRIQAARAAGFIPARLAVTALYESMADRSWWVRRAGGESLLRRGRWGLAALRKAMRSHPDRFAREMAAQILLDAGIIAAEDVPELRGTA